MQLSQMETATLKISQRDKPYASETAKAGSALQNELQVDEQNAHQNQQSAHCKS